MRHLRKGLAVFLLVTLWLGCAPEEKPRNVILLIGDGFGPAYETMGRDYAGRELPLDGLLVGAIRTAPTGQRVTDSAAGATAFSTGVKTYNGAIAVDTLKRPRATLLEAARQNGMRTGLVATSRITHATPAAFAAHVDSRSKEEEIAGQMLDHNVDVLFGGGWAYFVPEAQGGRRQDGRDLLAEAADRGYTVVRDRSAWDTLSTTPALALFTPSHMSYEIDRDSTREPSLAEMTEKALALLEGDPDGFFLMIEGSRIDHAGHVNDPATAVREVLMYNEAVARVLAFAREHPGTLVISTADHETGGLSLGRQIGERSIYDWYPEVLRRVQASAERMARSSKNLADALDWLARAGITDLDAEERAALERNLGNAPMLTTTFAHIISRRAAIGWTTHGHTAVDVSVYAYGPGADTFRGFQDNTHIGRGIARLMGWDLDALTEKLFAQQP